MSDLNSFREHTFFVSYNKEDIKWAEWIAWKLEEANFECFIQSWDIRPGNNFVMEMQNAAASNQRTIAVLSNHYLLSKFTQPEWASAFNQDPTGEKGILLPIRIEEVDLKGLWASIVYIDFVGLNEEEAEQALLDGINLKRSKPKTKPQFPGIKTPKSNVEATYPSNFVEHDPLKHWNVARFLTDEQENSDAFIISIRKKSSRLVKQNVQIDFKVHDDLVLGLLKSEGDDESIIFFKALFELLIPEALWNSFSEMGRFNITVDKRSTLIPWEGILAYSQTTKSGIFPNGMVIIRQLNAKNYSKYISSDYERPQNILNIEIAKDIVLDKGKPINEIFDMSMFHDFGYQVNKVSLKRGINILENLFELAYRIVHIEANGNIDDKMKGIPLGSNIYLNVHFFTQMEIIPELVYINFGIKDTVENNDCKKEPNDFLYRQNAASLALALSGIGVKAVVISSLPLERLTSSTFTDFFYRELLKGNTFAQAVKIANKEIFKLEPNIKTLSAYQCWGEINFRINESPSIIDDDVEPEV